jgi:hypothetical protein
VYNSFKNSKQNQNPNSDYVEEKNLPTNGKTSSKNLKLKVSSTNNSSEEIIDFNEYSNLPIVTKRMQGEHNMYQVS